MRIYEAPCRCGHPSLVTWRVSDQNTRSDERVRAASRKADREGLSTQQAHPKQVEGKDVYYKCYIDGRLADATYVEKRLN